MTKNFAFIDSRVADYQTLIAGLSADTEWVLLDGNKDGVLQMQMALSSYSNLDSIQVISHGSAGALYLGSTALNSSNLGLYESQLQGIGQSLSETGDILLYGCNVAQGDVGQQFIDSLAAITRADVAASTDLTGARAQDGNWVLEEKTGAIQATPIAPLSYTGTLLATTDIFANKGFYSTFAELSKAAYSLALNEELQSNQTDQAGNSIVHSNVNGTGANYIKPYADDAFVSVENSWATLKPADLVQNALVGQAAHGVFFTLEVDDKAAALALLEAPLIGVELSLLLAVTPTKLVQKDWYIENNGVYHCKNSAAFAVKSGDAVAISFRGTNDNDATHGTADELDWIYMSEHYAELKPFVDYIDNYVINNNIAKVYVTGHSLGGGMALAYMDKHQSGTTASGLAINYEAVTFAAPGYLVSGSLDRRVICLETDGDPVPDIKYHQGYVVSLDIDGLTHYTNNKNYSGTDFHSMDIYLQAANALDKELPGTTDRSTSSIHGFLPEMFSSIDYGLEVSLKGKEGAGSESYSWKDEVAPTFTLMSGNDNLPDTGNFGVTDYFLGGGGADILGGTSTLTNSGRGILIGGIDDDIYIVDDVLDVVIEKENAGTDTVQASVSYTLADNVDNLTLSPDGGFAWFDLPIDGAGNALANKILGNKSNNNIFGLSGTDTLDGYIGSDKLYGGIGDDILIAQDGWDTLEGGSGSDKYRVDRVDYDVWFSDNVPTYTISDESGTADWLSIYDISKGNFDGLADLNFRVFGGDLYIDIDIDISYAIDDNDDGRIIIKNAGIAANQIESLYVFDENDIQLGGAYSLASAYTALLATGTSDYYRMSAGAATADGAALQVVSGSATSGDGSSGSTVVGGASLGLGMSVSAQLDDIGYYTSYTVVPNQSGALVISLNLSRSYAFSSFEIDVYDPNNILLESFKTGSSAGFHVGVSSASAHTIRLTNIGDANTRIFPLPSDAGNFSISVAQADISKDYESERNDSRSTADVLVQDRATEGQLSQATDIDWYKVTPTQTGGLELTFEDVDRSGSHLYKIDVTDASGTVLESFDHNTYGGTYHVGVASTAAHYIKVSHEATGILDTGWYNLTVKQADISKDYESELNGSLATADAIVLGRATEGQLSKSTDVDWYKVTPTQTGGLELTFEDVDRSGSHLYKIDVTDASGTVLESIEHNTYGGTYHVGVASTAAHYIKVSHEATGILDTGWYNLTVKQADISKDYESELNGSLATADAIVLGRATEGQLSKSTDVDWYKVTPTQTGGLELTFEDVDRSGSHLYKIDVTDASGTVLESIDHNTYGGTYHVGVASTAAHYIKVSHEATGILDTGWYNLTVKQADISKDYESELNGSLATADAVVLGRTTEGQLSRSTDVDWYKVTPSQAGALEIVFADDFAGGSGGSHLYKIDVTDASGMVLESFNYNANYSATYHVGVASTAAHYIKVSHEATGELDTGWYNLTVKQAATSKDYESELNGTLATADAVVLGRITEGQLSQATDVDWYKVTPSQAGALEIVFSDDFAGGTGGSHLYKIDITDASGMALESFNYNDYYSATYHVGVASTAAHYIKVSHEATGELDTGWYNLTVKQADISKDYESELNGTLATADAVVLGRTTEGQLSRSTDVDWYKVTPSQAGALEIVFGDYFAGGSGGSHLYKIDVTDASGMVLESFNYNDSYSATYHVGVAATAAHYIKVSHEATGELDTGWYNLTVKQADISKGYESELNGTLATADAIVLGRATEGQLSRSTDVDWYKVTPSQAGALEVVFGDNFSGGYGGSHLYKIDITDASGTVLESFDFSNYAWETYHVGVASTAAHYIKVSHEATGELDTGWYNLTVKQAATSKDYESEANNSRLTADALKLGRLTEGQLSTTADSDWYAIAGLKKLTFSNPSGPYSFKADLTDQNGAVLSTFGLGSFTAEINLDNDALASTVRYIRIYHDSSLGTLNNGWYNLRADTAVPVNPLPDITRNEDSSVSVIMPTGMFGNVADIASYSCTLSSGLALPSWLTFNSSTLTLSGTPSNGNIGLYDIRIRANYTSGATVDDTFRLTVNNVNDAPTVTRAIADVSISEDGNLNLTLPADTFADVDVGDSLVYSAKLASGAVLPSWLTFNGTTRQFVGTPTNLDVGTSLVRVTASDQSGATVTDDFAINVVNTNDAPTSTNNTITVRGGVVYTFTQQNFPFGDIDAGDLMAKVKLINLPSNGLIKLNGISVNAYQEILAADISSGKLTFTPSVSTASTGGFLFAVSDGRVYSNSATLNLTVSAAPVSGTSGSDVLLGGAGADALSGAAGDDYLLGMAGNDILNGEAGADTLIGGDGSDLYYVDNIGDIVIETNAVTSTGGTDAIYSYLTHTALATYTLGANIENASIVTAAASNITGNTLNNLIYAGAGINRINGAAGVDTVSYYYATTMGTTGVTLALASTGSATASGISGGDVISNIENITGSIYADTLTGNAAANQLEGIEGNDKLAGGGGNDILIGGLGNDTLTGGAGADKFKFVTTGEGTDAITDFTSGSDKIQLVAANFGLVAGAAATLRKGASLPTVTGTAGQFLYNSTTGDLWFDQDGTGATYAAVQLATLSGLKALLASDIQLVAA